MKQEQRRQAIVDLLVESRSVDLDDLAARFAVSKMTVHRDLDGLEQAGVLRKVRGGATIEAGTQFESDFRMRARQDSAAKARMARAALELVEPGMTVMVNDGSMAAVLGATLAAKRPVTIITNNAAIIEGTREEGGINLISLGGVFRPRYHAYFGLVTEFALSRLNADIAFISAPAVADLRAFHMDDEVVRTKRAMMAAAERSCLLVSHQRFGRSALHRLAELSEFDAVITDDVPPEADHAALEQHGIALTIARD
ncbi:MAG: DeoR/GlpR family DNA-binding transcription regulator [Rhizobiaceae bacterium]|nr:DeoR/GlpR family DNA-binding transcription regulator [Rhizobiaceae bacterium]